MDRPTRCPACHRPVKPPADPKAAVKCRHCGTPVWQSADAGGGGYSLAEDSTPPGLLPPASDPRPAKPRVQPAADPLEPDPPANGKPALIGGLLALVGAVVAVGGYLLFARPTGQSEQAAAPTKAAPPPTVASTPPKFTAPPIPSTPDPTRTVAPPPTAPGKRPAPDPLKPPPPAEPRGKPPTIRDPDKVPPGETIDGWPPGVSEEAWDAALKSLRASADWYVKDAPDALNRERARLTRLKAATVVPGSPTSEPATGHVTFASADEKARAVAACEDGIAWYERAPAARTERDYDHFVGAFPGWTRAGVVGRISDDEIKWSHFPPGGVNGLLDHLPNAVWVYLPAYSSAKPVMLRNIGVSLFREGHPVRCPGVYIFTSVNPPTLTRVSFTVALRE